MRGANQVKDKPLKYVFVISVVIFLYVQTCFAQDKSGQVLDDLAKSSKLIESNLVLEDFTAGDATTRVIITLLLPARLLQKNRKPARHILQFRGSLRSSP